MKFSIITVVKNGLSKIGLSVQSLKNQTFKDYEHIIFDGESNDGTSEYLKKNLDDKTLYFRDRDNGVYDAINKSFKKVRGKYVILLHAGDFFYSKYSLADLSKFIDNNDDNFDFYYSNMLFYNNRNMNISRVWKIPLDKTNKLNFLKIAHTTLCINRKVSQSLFYDETFKISADIDYLYNLCKNFNGKYFNNFLIYMEDQGLSNSRKYFHTRLKEDMRILYKRFNVFCLFVLIYKVFIKIPGFFSKKNVYDKNFKIEKKILS